MSENLTKVLSSTLAALDALDQVLSLQELVRLALEEFDDQDKRVEERVGLLLSVYLYVVEEHFEELESNLKDIQLKIGKSVRDSLQETESQNPFQL